MTGDGHLDDVKELVLKLATITSQVDQRNHESMQRIDGSVQLLDDASQRFQGCAEQFASAVMQAVGMQVQGVVTERSAQALDHFNEQLRAGSENAKRATEAMAEQRKLLNAAQRTLVWKGLTALLIGSVLAAIAGGFLFWQTRQMSGDPALAAEVRQALNSGALARCSGNQLCARTSVVRHGSQRTQSEYVIVR